MVRYEENFLSTPSSKAELHSFIPNSLTSPYPQLSRGMGNGVTGSSYQFISAIPSSSHSPPAPSWDPHQGLQLLPGAWPSVGSPLTAASFREYLSAVAWDAPCTAVWIYLLQHGFLWAQPLHGLQENLYFGIWSIPSLSFFTDLGVCRIVSHTSFPHLFLSQAAM